MKIQENIRLAPYTTFKIGGPAKWFACVSNTKEIQEILFWSREKNIPIFFLGGGSNVLISDKGFDGLVIHLENIDPIINNFEIKAFSGTSLKDVAIMAQKNSLAGMENLYGIPGSVGGAVRGNAGAFGVEMKNVVSQVEFIDKRNLEIQKISSKECHFSYRTSVFKERGDKIITHATFLLKQGDTDELEKVMKDVEEKRNSRQDQSAMCAGSFFVNPIVENKELRLEFEKEVASPCRENKVPAGWLIDKVGLRGKRIGDAMVSETHPNYILNVGRATSDEIIMLMSYIKQQVRDNFGVELVQEVEFVGF
ncbi:MAG: UDP-N-acetylmuramate dehydrogenase [Candidatus Moraniibacteriota bacterium]|nr:MAG: UDP-N-acetylmuramate dehydrogenase [Candidatus Moranbacteria bacterium]